MIDPRAYAVDDVPPGAAGRLESFRRFLDTENQRLRARHEFGHGGKEIARARSDVLDTLVRRACRMVADDLGPKARADLAASAILALGSYGRWELGPFSGIEIRFLHPGELSAARVDFVERLPPLLERIGLGVGHDVRSIVECVELALGGVAGRNTLSDARLVVGDIRLFELLQRELFAEVYRNANANERFEASMLAEFRERRGRHGRIGDVAEPELGEGAGGLRDVHTVCWVGLARHQLTGLEELLAHQVITPSDYGRVRRANDFLLRVRNETHYRAEDSTDRLSLELQGPVAEGLGYDAADGASGPERMMAQLGQRASEVAAFADTFLERT